MTRDMLTCLLAVAMVATLAAGCSTYRTQGRERAAEVEGETELRERARATIARFRQQDPTLEDFFQNSYAFAVFPEVTKGGAGVGAAFGRGVVYRNGQLVGYARVQKGTVGATLGAMTFRELIFFEDEISYREFTEGTMELAAGFSAVAAANGAGASADYTGGVAVFTMPSGGLMIDISVGGQGFSFTPIEEIPGEPAPTTEIWIPEGGELPGEQPQQQQPAQPGQQQQQQPELELERGEEGPGIQLEQEEGQQPQNPQQDGDSATQPGTEPEGEPEAEPGTSPGQTEDATSLAG